MIKLKSNGDDDDDDEEDRDGACARSRAHLSISTNRVTQMDGIAVLSPIMTRFDEMETRKKLKNPKTKQKILKEMFIKEKN